MKDIRVNAAENISKKFKKDGYVAKGEVLDNNVVDISYICEDGKLYGGFLFVPNASNHFCKYGRKTKKPPTKPIYRASGHSRTDFFPYVVIVYQ